MKTSLRSCLTFIAIVVVPSIIFAQTQSAPAAAGFKGDLLKEVAEVEQKIVSLAEAFPAEKYSWRPAQDVRSVSEVLMHIAGANYMLPGMAGITPPPGISGNMEKTVTEKAKVIEVLKQSFVHLKQGLQNTSDADFDKGVKFFGDEATVRYVFMVAAAHGNEHLGQSIAYARINGITPPWSAN